MKSATAQWTVGDGQPGPVTMRLRQALLDIQTGRARGPVRLDPPHRLSWPLMGVREHRIQATGGALLAIGLLYLAFLGGAEGRPAAALFLVALVAVVVGGVLIWWGRRRRPQPAPWWVRNRRGGSHAGRGSWHDAAMAATAIIIGERARV